MEFHWQRIAAILVFTALLAQLWVRGIVPSVSHLDTDFPNYLTAAKIVATGGQVERLYDTPWFREQARAFGFPEQQAQNSKFDPFPPPTAFVMLPLAPLAPMTALRVMTGASLLCLALSAVVLARVLGWRLLDTAVFLLLSGYAVLNALKFGQPYILVATSCILGWYAYLKRWPLLAGLCFGLFLPIKYFPLAILLYFASRREWRVVIGGALAVTAIMVASIGVLGWQLHETFLSSVLGNHLLARLNLQDPFSTSFQSFDVLSRRLLLFDSGSNPHPWLDLPDLQPIVLAVTKCAIAAVAIATLVRLARSGERAVAPSIGLIGISVLLLAPSTATYHYVLIWLPVGLLVQHFTRERAPACAWFVLGAYTLIGFLPYGHTNVFETRGALAVIAFPRLWVLLALFAVCVRCLWTGTDLLPERATRRPAFQ